MITTLNINPATMNAILDIIQKLQDTQEMIRKTKNLEARYPRDYGILANLESLEYRALSLEVHLVREYEIGKA